MIFLLKDFSEKSLFLPIESLLGSSLFRAKVNDDLKIVLNMSKYLHFCCTNEFFKVKKKKEK